MDNFPTVIAFKDREGRFLDVNKIVEDVLGLPKEQIVGRTMYEFIPKAAADVLRQHEIKVKGIDAPCRPSIVKIQRFHLFLAPDMRPFDPA